MRYGKRLALQVIEDDSGAPYISNNALKDVMNKIGRHLRTSQIRLGATDKNEDDVSVYLPAEAECEDKTTIENSIRSLEVQLYEIIENDFGCIFRHICSSESEILLLMTSLQTSAKKLGLLFGDQANSQDASTDGVETSSAFPSQESEPEIPHGTFSEESRFDVVCINLIELQVAIDPGGFGSQLDIVWAKYAAIVTMINGHCRYIEINVAGFRKLLKRHEKQVLAMCRDDFVHYTGFHRLVTPVTVSLLRQARLLGKRLADARQCLHHAIAGDVAVRKAGEILIPVLQGLGTESRAVLLVQGKLCSNDEFALGANHSDASGRDTLTASCLYPKPSALGPMVHGKPFVPLVSGMCFSL